ncbi:MAG: TetR/AcrR family transcriptional regulator [Anaerolineales bacterium]
MTERARLGDKQETRQAIIATALDLIQRDGPDRFSLREIARRIGYSPAGLYEYFDGKAEIVQAVRERAMKEFLDAMRSVPQDLPSDDYLVRLGLAYIGFATRHPQEFLLLLTHLRGVVEESETERDLSQGSYWYLDHAIERAIEDDVIRPDVGLQKDEAAYAMWSLAHGMAMLQVSYLRELNLDFERVDATALRALVAGLGAP